MRTSFRIEWDAIPAPVRAAIDAELGSAVVEAVNQTGGYSPSLAARCRLADGRRVFLKAGADVQGMNPLVPFMLRNEAALCAHWPEAFPAPRLLATHDDGQWIAVVFEDVAGHNPVQPWRDDDLSRMVRVVDELPTPAELPLPRATQQLVPTFGGFADLAAGTPPRLPDDWTVRHLDTLASLEAAWPAAVDGDALVHGDVRDDNVLLADDGRTLLVDWAHSGIGADWLDLVFCAPSVELAGGPACQAFIERSTSVRRAEAEEVTTVVVALLGFFTRESLRPPPPGVPAVRAFQEAQRQVAADWLRQRRSELG